MYTFGNHINMVDDAHLKAISAKYSRICNLQKKIKQFESEMLKLKDEINTTIIDAREYGYTDCEIAEKVGTIYM